ncbi:cytochrome P450 [Novosphingobium sp.]|uniref:cytochrome P450 n=1 Tax=Novosphingobium sp. TaxID=1874826 RepID=UPI003BAB0975
MNQALSDPIPDHVPASLVFPFDLYALSDDPRLADDTQAGLTFLHRGAPDVFFTPQNGGHWVATRHDLMREVLMNPDRFSSAQLGVPKTATQSRLIPLSLDPPQHTPYRRILMQHFAPKRISRMADDIRMRAIGLIEQVRERGSCDFLNEVGMPLPVQVFMDMMGLPAEKFDVFRAIVVEWFATPNGPRRQVLAGTILGHLREVIDQRKATPQEDLMTALLSESIKGRPLSQDEVESMAFLLFLAGLDTVANAAGFMMARLARMPELQRNLREDSALVDPFIDEVLRTSGVVTTARLVTQDCKLGEAVLMKGDMVLCPLALAGMDDRVNSDPLEFKLDRKSPAHLMFATGPHLCVGHFLARLELRILLQEWLRLVPQFSLNPNVPREVRIGSMTAFLQLGIKWST